MTHRTRISPLLCLLSISTLCFAQLAETDTAFLAKAKENNKRIYFQSIKGQSRLYNGSDHVMYQSRREEHPYFALDDWTFGTIVYDEDLYEDVPLMYDLSLDKVLTEHILNGNLMELVDKKIRRFTILEHTFVRLEKDTNKISEGFYELLYNGPSKVYAKYEKTRQEHVYSNETIAEFDEKNRIYIVRKGIYFQVKTKASVVQVFSDSKQAVKRFISKNRARFKTNPGEVIAQVAAFYDTQKN